MTNNINEFRDKFQVDKMTILKLDYWTWSLRPTHSTIGAGILSLNRFCTSFGSITTDEASELATATKEIERKLQSAFAPNKFNYVMLMMVDAHLHFHVIPRYSDMREFSGVSWKDNGWPALPVLSDGSQFAQDPILLKIRDALIKA